MGPKNIQFINPNPKNEINEFHSNVGDEFVLCKHGNIFFMWADFFETCDNVKANVDFTKKEAALSFLKRIPIWIRAHNKIHTTSMYDLYEKFILSKSEIIGGVDPFEVLEMSFISSTGPFKKMSLAESFNKETYKEFIEIFLIRGKLPKRDYRIRLKSKILFEYGSSFEKAELVSLEQLTTKGMLFSLDADTFKKQFRAEEKLRILIDSSVLREAKNKSLQELKSYLGNYSFNLLYSTQREDALEINMADISVNSSFDFHKDRKVFLFVPFSKLSGEKKFVVDNILGFVDQTKDLVRSHFTQKARSA